MTEKKFTIKLEEYELKPKSPIREKEFGFQELMVRNTQLIIEQNKKILEENNFLKSKVGELEGKIDKQVEEHNKDILHLTKVFMDKTLPLAERIEKAQKRQVKLLNDGHKVQMLRSLSDGVTIVPGVNGITTIVY